MLRFASREIAADYTNEFEQMFDGRFGTSKRSTTPYSAVRLGSARVEIYFSPQDGVAKHVLQRLAAAKHSIHFMTFSYTSSAIADAMVAQAQAGLPVRGVFESQNADEGNFEICTWAAQRCDDHQCLVIAPLRVAPRCASECTSSASSTPPPHRTAAIAMA